MGENARFADLYVGYPLPSHFTYEIPEDLPVVPGKRVKVNFAGRNTTGFVFNIHSIKPRVEKIKKIIDVIDCEPVFDGRLVDLARYTASSYLSSAGEAISMALPSGFAESKRYKLPFEKRSSPEVRLTGEQSGVSRALIQSLENGELKHLIFGVTGSGKTEIYLDIMKHIIGQGRSVIYLVPEISLSSQIYERLYAVFGDDMIVYHSQLTKNQRLYNWKRFYSGAARVAVGTRSAVFLQSPEPGLIIIDEEHDSSYKEHSSPRYSARHLAFYRSSSEKIMVILGSATPSIETLYAAEKGAIKLHLLKERYGNYGMPDIEVVQVRPSGDDAVSSRLKLFTKQSIDKGRQVIYLLNRRGFSPFVICGDCGYVIECPLCNISMNYHREGSLLCHYCGSRSALPLKCPQCAAENLVKFGTGTQKAEEQVASVFRGLRIFRLDQDSARKKGASHELIRLMNAGEIDLLIGTQMVAKGFHFPNVVLVGILLADIGLNIPDFRAAERIFALMVQVSGRCGRGDEKGRVIIQTLDEGNEIFDYIKGHDYYGFYRSELELRRAAGYPPFSRLARLLVRGEDESHVKRGIEEIREKLESIKRNKKSDITVLGPSAAPVSKISNKYRYHVILKSAKSSDLKIIINALTEGLNLRNLYLEIDIDPVDMM